MAGREVATMTTPTATLCKDGDCFFGVELPTFDVAQLAAPLGYVLHFSCALCGAKHEIPFKEGAHVQCQCGAGWYLDAESLRLLEVPELTEA